MTKIEALAKHLDCSVDEISEVGHRGDYFEHHGEEYWVMTDDEAEEAWDRALQDYLDDHILFDLPEMARNYFDSDAWKRDARHDGRGHSLSSYDGEEHEIRCEDGTYLYIYRTN